ncbi:MAG: methylenetetrahydrofolate reductase [NAD(P)H] [Bdellovibrionales bacterium]
MSIKPSISFEFFPPKTADMAAQLWDAVPVLEALGPAYMTVTYGAGGSTKDGTLEALRKMRGMTDVPLAAHLSFLSTKKADLDAYLDDLWNAGVQHIVALRGDLPKGTRFEDFSGTDYYAYTYDFIEAIKAKNDFKITVGGYPEKHPDAPSLAADIAHLKKKCDAGADAVTTQYFFDNDVFYNFVETCRAAGITTPIQPGLMPIYDFENCKRFSARCDASIPAWLHEKFDGLETGSEEAIKVATDLLILQAEDLVAKGIPHLHFYSMNKAPIVADVCEALGY